jgi:hypothetical protein
MANISGNKLKNWELWNITNFPFTLFPLGVGGGVFWEHPCCFQKFLRTFIFTP